MRALVLDGDSRAALAIVRSLGKRGVDVVVASYGEPCLAGCSRWRSENLVYPSPVASPKPFREWLVSTLSAMPDTLLYTCSDITTSIAGKCRLSLPKSATMLLPPQDSLETALDKSATLDLASSLAVPIPQSVEFRRDEPIDTRRVTFGYPAAVKGAQSDLPHRLDTVYLSNPVELRLALVEVLRESESALVQEVISGRGTAIFALFDSGEPVATFAHRRLREKPPRGGVSVLSESIEPPPDMLDCALRLLTELRWHGVVMVEFKTNADGIPVLMEINPRFWGSLELAIKSGVDFPYLALGLAMGERVCTPRQRHAINRWVLGELDSLIASVRTELGKRRALAPLRHLWDLRLGLGCEVERITDPRPALYEYATWLKTAARRVRSGRKGDETQLSSSEKGTPLALSSEARAYRRAVHGPPRFDTAAGPGLLSASGITCSRGVVHIHTEFSFDGSLSIARIAAMCRDRGLSFAAIADHAESVDEDSMRRLVAECKEVSGSDFVMIPGIEHRCQRGAHILAFGQRRLISAESTLGMLEALHADGCVLVAAHFMSAHDLPPELVEILTAMEIWNVSRDTRLLPTSRHIPVYRTLAARYSRLYALGGLDMHKGNEWACETVLDPPCEARPDAVLARLKAGQFATESRFLSFGSRPAGGIRDIAFAAGDLVFGIRDLRDRAESKRNRSGSSE